MSHKKAGGSTSLGRDSQGKRLGIKAQNGQRINQGQVIVRQRGTKYYPGLNVKRGGDDTLLSTKPGIVKFSTKKVKRFDGKLKPRNIVSIETEKKTS
ncbi:50S ribosomal protein L27 [bacterium]|nr:50S ribosomal protein L27 [bacterium]